jgi:hypothetical protein
MPVTLVTLLPPVVAGAAVVAPSGQRPACVARAAPPLRRPASLRHLESHAAWATHPRRAVRRWAGLLSQGSSSAADDGAPPLESASASDAGGDGDTSSSASSSTLPGVRIDLGLPRRSRLVAFTCNKCGEFLFCRAAAEEGEEKKHAPGWPALRTHRHHLRLTPVSPPLYNT